AHVARLKFIAERFGRDAAAEADHRRPRRGETRRDRAADAPARPRDDHHAACEIQRIDRHSLRILHPGRSPSLPGFPRIPITIRGLTDMATAGGLYRPIPALSSRRATR